MPESNRPLDWEITSRDGVTVVIFGPQYESIYENDLQEFMNELILLGHQSESPNVVLDLLHTMYVGSAFLGLLTRLSNRLRARGGQLALCRLTPFVASTVNITQLNRVFGVHATRDEAISSLKNSECVASDSVR